MPGDIAGIGSTTQKLRARPGFDPMRAGIGPEEYFVFSRVDGVTALRDLLLATGLPPERAVAIISKLRSIGAVLLPSERDPVAVGASPPAAPPVLAPRTITARTTGAPTSAPMSAPSTSASSLAALSAVNAAASAAGPARPRTITARTAGAPPPPAQPPVDRGPHDLELPNPTAEELAALAEPGDLRDRDRRLVLAMARVAHDPRQLLGVSTIADTRTLKHAYFRLSKEVHPDRYYGKRLGSFNQRLEVIFEALARAYSQLSGSDTKKHRASAAQAEQQQQQQPQTPSEYAAELFTRACDLEIGGAPLEAMKLFAAAVRMDPQLRYLRRAASCALAAEQPKSALEYAKKVHVLAPNDPSSARLLASAFRAGGKLADAEEVLIMAMAMKTENDTLTTELRNDLAEVRRALAAT